MIELMSQKLANVAYYKDAEFAFEPGITCILGENRNAKTQGASNGSGKSSLFTPLHTSLGYEAPLTKGRLGVKDIFGTGTSTTLEFKRGKHVYTSTRKGSKFTVLRDGQDLGIRTQADALKRLAALRGLTEAQFYATVYLDSSKPHLFQSGSSTQRLEFFTDLFDLHDVDAVKSWCLSMQREARSAAGEVQRLTAELATVQDVDTAKSLVEYQELVKKQDRTQTLLGRLTSIKHLAELWASRSVVDKRVADLLIATKVFGHTLKSVKAELQAHADHERETTAHDTWTKQRRSLVREVRELQSRGLPKSLKDAKTRLRELDDLGRARAPAPVEAPAPTDVKLLLRKLPEPGAHHVKTLEKKSGELRGKRQEVRDTLATLQEHDVEASTCPLCKTGLKPHHFKTLRTTLEEQEQKLARQQDMLRRLSTTLGQYLEHQDWQKQQRAYEKQTCGYERAQHKDLGRYVKLLQTFKELDAHEPQVTVVQHTHTVPELHELREKLLELRTLQAQPGLPADAESTLRSFATTNNLAFDAALLRTVAMDWTEKNSERLRALNSRIPQLRSALDMAAADRKRRRRLLTELREQQAAAADLPVLELLVDAYSKAGIKSLMVRRLAKLVEKNLNRLSSTILREPMKFELVVDGANFHVLANRRNRGKARVSDVRTLSGAERRMFILLFLLASLPLLPASKRYDTLVLDEPFANLDVPNQADLRDRLLPRLLKVVPKLVVLVTDPHQVPGGSRVITAVKSNDCTTLVRTDHGRETGNRGSAGLRKTTSRASTGTRGTTGTRRGVPA